MDQNDLFLKFQVCCYLLISTDGCVNSQKYFHIELLVNLAVDELSNNLRLLFWDAY